MQSMFILDESDVLEDMSGMFAEFSVPNSPVTPTQTPVTQAPVMLTHGDVDTSMEVDGSEMQAGADLGSSAAPAAGAEPVVAETHLVLEGRFSNLESHRDSMPRRGNLIAQALGVSESARRFNVEKLKMMRRSVLEVDTWGWHPDSPQHRPASPIQDLTFTDCSTFEGVGSVWSHDDPPFQVQYHSVPDAHMMKDHHHPHLGSGSELCHQFHKIPEQKFFAPVQFPVQSPLPPDIEDYLRMIAKYDRHLVKVSSRRNASGHRVCMHFDLRLTRQMFEHDTTVRSTGATRKIFCVTQVELDAQGSETRRLESERMCCCGTWPLEAGVTHGVHTVHRLRDCPQVSKPRR
jgi:hypothetical protein